ncbi:MAG: hypothetical protein ACRDF4_09455 [Rhabdochlamydiaceae bacterium]
MMIVQPWTEEETLKKEVKSCDNHDVGEIQEINPNFVICKKGSRILRIPRDSVATFDGDKMYLRATEAEIMTGVYPFLRKENFENSPSSAGAIESSKAT